MTEPMTERGSLEAAFRALRDEVTEVTVTGGDARIASTRRAVLLAAGTRRRRHAVAVRWAVPLAAVLAASAAWAGATGRLQRIATDARAVLLAEPHRGDDVLTPSSFAPRGAPSASTVRGAPSTPPDELLVVPSAERPVASASAQLSARSLTVPSPSAPLAGGVAPRSHGHEAAGASAATVDPEEALYRAAHQEHFVAHDQARALAAWEAYLAAYPRGRFAPEARYNRALSLVRLGRRAEARAALRPFADGALGAYRQAEARRLLEALE